MAGPGRNRARGLIQEALVRLILTVLVSSRQLDTAGQGFLGGGIGVHEELVEADKQQPCE